MGGKVEEVAVREEEASRVGVASSRGGGTRNVLEPPPNHPREGRRRQRRRPGEEGHAHWSRGPAAAAGWRDLVLPCGAPSALPPFSPSPTPTAAHVQGELTRDPTAPLLPDVGGDIVLPSSYDGGGPPSPLAVAR